MTTETLNPYLKNKVLTANPAELRMLLIEGAIRFTQQGRDGMAEKNYEKTFEGLSQSKAIIMELINGLRPEIDADLCDKLGALYTFMYRRLIDANLEKDPAIIDEVLKLLEYERETWSMLMDKLVEEKKTDFTGGPTTPSPNDPQNISSINFEG